MLNHQVIQKITSTNRETYHKILVERTSNSSTLIQFFKINHFCYQHYYLSLKIATLIKNFKKNKNMGEKRIKISTYCINNLIN